MVRDTDLEAFSQDWRTHDAILHNLEIIGEAVKRLPESLKSSSPAIPWKRIAGFRNVLAHAYFTLDDSIIWDVAVHQIDPLLETIEGMLSRLDP